MDNLSKQTISNILSHYTGVDRSVFDSVSIAKSREEFKKLLKEFQLIISILHKGNPGHLISIIKKYESHQISDIELYRTINSLIEFGKKYEDLNSDECIIVDRSEVQEELRHFWRIMGVDSLLVNERKHNIKRLVGDIDEISKYCGNLERCAMVVEERIKLRDRKNTNVIDRDSKIEAKTSNLENGISLNRKNNPYSGIAIYSDILDKDGLKELSILFERMSVKYSLETSLLLFDYYLTQKYINKKIKLAVWQETSDNNLKVVKIFTIGNFETLLIDPKNKAIISRNKNRSRSYAGNFNETDYYYFEYKVEDGYKIILNDITNAHGRYNLIDLKKLESELFEKVEGRLDIKNNYKNILTKYANLRKKSINIFDVGKSESSEIKKIDEVAIRELLNPIIQYIDDKLASRKVAISLEAGHIHCDRELSTKQIQGMKIGGIISKILKQKFKDKITILHQPMVDEDHVVNRLDYNKYEEYAEKNLYKIDELIFESSPIIRQVSFDIYRFININKDKKSNLKKLGDNIYFKLDKSKFIELIENAGYECTLGCVLFDAGLCLYRQYRNIVTKAFVNEMKESGIANETLTDIHRSQKILYNNIKDSRERRIAYEDKYKYILKTQNFKSKKLKYISGIKEYDAIKSEETLLINVLEGFYGSQQDKLKSLYKILGLPLNLWTVTFDEFGNLGLTH